MNSLPLPYSEETKKTIVPPLTQKAKFEKFCSEVNLIKQEAFKTFIEFEEEKFFPYNRSYEYMSSMVTYFIKYSKIIKTKNYWEREWIVYYVLPEEISNIFIKWTNKKKYKLASFMNIVELWETLKNHFCYNEKKNWYIYDDIVYNRNIKKFLYHISSTEVWDFLYNLSYVVTQKIDKDKSIYPYEIKEISEILLKNNIKIKVIKFNSFYYLSFEEVNQEILDFLKKIDSDSQVNIERDIYRKKLNQIYTNKNVALLESYKINANLIDILNQNQDFMHIKLDFEKNEINNKTTPRDIQRIQNWELFISKQYFDGYNSLIDRVAKRNIIPKEVIDYIDDLRAFSREYHNESDIKRNFEDTFIIFEAILSKFWISLEKDYKEFLENISLLFILDDSDTIYKSFNSDIKGFLEFIEEKMPEKYNKIFEKIKTNI